MTGTDRLGMGTACKYAMRCFDFGKLEAGKVLMFLAFLVGALLLDATVKPRPAIRVLLHLRSMAGLCLHTLIVASVFGLLLLLCGNVPAAALLSLGIVALFTIVSNAKRAMLGEALVFSDLALIGAVFRHPQFYLSALGPVQKAALGALGVLLPVTLWALFVPLWQPHVIGLAMVLGGITLIRVLLRLSPWADLAQTPDAEADVERHGLLPTILLHWQRWRETPDPAPRVPFPARPADRANERPVAVIVQCESFADPVELFGNAALSLPGLAAARAQAWQWGNLMVSGFGAYTMRTEYGVLFGRGEDELGFRRFDPFLTAQGEASYALPARLHGAGWHSLFVHPHDLRFYNREEIMQAGGFAELVGEDRFSPPGPGEGRYVSDAAIAGEIMRLARDAATATLIYAVTIENHGPWAASPAELEHDYMRLVRKGDAMLAGLSHDLGTLGRPATLVFFGDHRPAIPGLSMPGGARHTPYVIIRLDSQGDIIPGERRKVDLTPADLHHTVAELLAS